MTWVWALNKKIHQRAHWYFYEGPVPEPEIKIKINLIQKYLNNNAWVLNDIQKK